MTRNKSNPTQEEILEFFAKQEGRFQWIYSDIKGIPTVGIGTALVVNVGTEDAPNWEPREDEFLLNLFSTMGIDLTQSVSATDPTTKLKKLTDALIVAADNLDRDNGEANEIVFPSSYRKIGNEYDGRESEAPLGIYVSSPSLVEAGFFWHVNLETAGRAGLLETFGAKRLSGLTEDQQIDQTILIWNSLSTEQRNFIGNQIWDELTDEEKAATGSTTGWAGVGDLTKLLIATGQSLMMTTEEQKRMRNKTAGAEVWDNLTTGQKTALSSLWWNAQTLIGSQLTAAIFGAVDSWILVKMAEANGDMGAVETFTRLARSNEIKAWYEIAYRSNENHLYSVQNRRIEESDMFGLYGNGYEPLDVKDAKMVVAFLNTKIDNMKALLADIHDDDGNYNRPGYDREGELNKIRDSYWAGVKYLKENEDITEYNWNYEDMFESFFSPSLAWSPTVDLGFDLETGMVKEQSGWLSVLYPEIRNLVLAGEGDDTVSTGAGADAIYAGDGDDFVYAGSGNDYLNGGLGNNFLDGGDPFQPGDPISSAGGDADGTDIADYSNSDGGVTVHAATQTVDHDGKYTDTYRSIENFVGSKTQEDIADYSGFDATGAVSFVIEGEPDLTTVRSGNGDHLNFTNFDKVVTGKGDDTFKKYDIGMNFDGGAGTDTVNYHDMMIWTDQPGVYVDLKSGIARYVDTASNPATETIANVEKIIGTDGNDVIIGDDNNNVINGVDGADTLNGGLGSDTYVVWSAPYTGTTTISDTGGQSDLVITYGAWPYFSNNFFADGNDIVIGDSQGVSGSIRLKDQLTNHSIEWISAGNVLFTPEELLRISTNGRAFMPVDFVMPPDAGGNIISGDRVWVSGQGWVYQPVADNLVGTANNDTIDSGELNDTLHGAAGNDILYGGNGDDTLIGDSGSDFLIGEEGSDTYVFSPGCGIDEISDGYEALGNGNRIVLSGINPADVRYNVGLGYNGTPENDLYVYLGGSDMFRIYYQYGYGGDMNVSISSITGSVSQDLTGGLPITGTSGDDELGGTPFADVLTGGAGFDYMAGGGGDDRYVITTDSGRLDNIVETVNGGSDTILFQGVRLAELKFISGGDGLTIATRDGTRAVEVGGWLSNGRSVEWLEADDGRISLTSGGFTLEGTDLLPDTIKGTDAADTIYGNGGDDYLIGNGGADHIYGGLGDDYLSAGDWYRPSAQDCTLDGGTGDDCLNGDAGGDTLLGGSGEDIIWGETWWSEGFGNDYIDAGEGNDIVCGGGGADIIYAGDGADIIYGEDYFGDLAGEADVLHGGAGSDQIYGNGGDDIIMGDEGNDILVGDDYWYANEIAGNDTLDGGLGDDILDGGAGDDTLRGGAGSDLYFASNGNDTIIDGGNVLDNDVLRLWEGVSAHDLSLTRDGNDLVISQMYSIEQRQIRLTNQYSLEEEPAIDRILLSNGQELDYGFIPSGTTVSGDAVSAGPEDANIANQLNLLVQEMASFAPPPSANLNLPPEAQEQYNSLLTASNLTKQVA